MITNTTTRRRVAVPKIRVGPTGQVKIPAVIVKRYNLEKGDILDVRDIGNSIIFIPERVKKNQKLRRELNERIWNQMEQEAEDDVKSGRVSGPFETVEELLRDLKEK